MTNLISALVSLTYSALVVVFVIVSWRRTRPNRDRHVWWLALPLLLIAVPRATLNPEPGTWGRVAAAVAITVFVISLVANWRHSGVPCRVHGHEWVVVAETTTGQSVRITVPTPEMEQRILSELVPRLLGVHWSDAIIVSRHCMVCGKVNL